MRDTKLEKAKYRVWHIPETKKGNEKNWSETKETA